MRLIARFVRRTFRNRFLEPAAQRRPRSIQGFEESGKRSCRKPCSRPYDFFYVFFFCGHFTLLL
jgi:hypothetical protein